MIIYAYIATRFITLIAIGQLPKPRRLDKSDINRNVVDITFANQKLSIENFKAFKLHQYIRCVCCNFKCRVHFYKVNKQYISH